LCGRAVPGVTCTLASSPTVTTAPTRSGPPDCNDGAIACAATVGDCVQRVDIRRSGPEDDTHARGSGHGERRLTSHPLNWSNSSGLLHSLRTWGRFASNSQGMQQDRTARPVHRLPGEAARSVATPSRACVSSSGPLRPRSGQRASVAAGPSWGQTSRCACAWGGASVCLSQGLQAATRQADPLLHA
jgi:hypothetical protein